MADDDSTQRFASTKARLLAAQPLMAIMELCAHWAPELDCDAAELARRLTEYRLSWRVGEEEPAPLTLRDLQSPLCTVLLVREYLVDVNRRARIEGLTRNRVLLNDMDNHVVLVDRAAVWAFVDAVGIPPPSFWPKPAASAAPSPSPPSSPSPSSPSASPAPPPPEAARGRKPGASKVEILATPIAAKILEDDSLRPAPGHGRLRRLAELVQKDETVANYALTTLEKALRVELREWEKGHPQK